LRPLDKFLVQLVNSRAVLKPNVYTLPTLSLLQKLLLKLKLQTIRLLWMLPMPQKVLLTVLKHTLEKLQLPTIKQQCSLKILLPRLSLLNRKSKLLPTEFTLLHRKLRLKLLQILEVLIFCILSLMKHQPSKH